MKETNKFAVVKIKNSQFKVSEGDVINVAKMEGKAGDKLSFDEVLLMVDGSDVKVGKPTIEKAKIAAEIVEQTKGEKVKMMTYKAKSHQRRRRGHRQKLTKIKINKIT